MTCAKVTESGPPETAVSIIELEGISCGKTSDFKLTYIMIPPNPSNTLAPVKIPELMDEFIINALLFYFLFIMTFCQSI